MATESFFSNASLAYLASAGAGKDGKTYSIKPNDGTGDFTFSRGSNLAATRVGPTGLIEKGRENLLLQSNQFDTTWTNYLVSVTSGQPDKDGGSDAWLLSKSGESGRLLQNISNTNVSTYSIYAKAGTLDWILLFVLDSSVNPRAYFDLSNGIIGTNNDIIDSNIEDVGNGWYRCSITYNKTITQVRVFPADGDNDTSGTSGSIYIQDAQLEIGLAATDYIESGATTGKAGLLEDEPRFDYSGGATCPSLLLEPSRTNLVKNSEYYSGSDWISNNVTITDNATTSPEGLQNASLINFTSSGNYFQHQGPAIVSGSTYTISCYAKRAISTDQVFRLYGNNNKTSANLTATSEWQRFTHTFTADTTNFASGLSAPSTAEIHLYGVQVEEGSYPTSYIPNHSGGNVTRGAETSNVGSLQSNGIISALDSYTIFFDISKDEGDKTADGSNSTWLVLENSSAQDIFTLRKNNALNQKYYTLFSNRDASDVFDNETINKACFRVTSNEVKVYLDGVIVATYTPTNNHLDLNKTIIKYGTNNRTSMVVSQFLLFNEALSDADCIALTTL